MQLTSAAKRPASLILRSTFSQISDFRFLLRIQCDGKYAQEHEFEWPSQRWTSEIDGGITREGASLALTILMRQRFEIDGFMEIVVAIYVIGDVGVFLDQSRLLLIY